MRSTSVTRTVDAPVETLWSLATDLEHWPAVVSTIERVEVLAGDGFAVGTRWRETRRMMGREATEEMSVTEVRPGRSNTAEADGPGVRYESTWSFEPTAPDRTTVTFTFGARPTGVLAKAFLAVAGGVVMRSVRKAARGDLDDLAAAAERA